MKDHTEAIKRIKDAERLWQRYWNDAEFHAQVVTYRNQRGEFEVTPELLAAVEQVVGAAIPQNRRHPAHVTADRLKDAYQRYYDRMDGSERDALSKAIFVLEQIGDGAR